MESVHFVHMLKSLPAAKFRQHLSAALNAVIEHNQVIGIRRRNRVEAIVLKWPGRFNGTLDEITNFNANSSSFDFLEDEPDLYSVEDLKRRYV